MRGPLSFLGSCPATGVVGAGLFLSLPRSISGFQDWDARHRLVEWGGTKAVALVVVAATNKENPPRDGTDGADDVVNNDDSNGRSPAVFLPPTRDSMILLVIAVL